MHTQPGQLTNKRFPSLKVWNQFWYDTLSQSGFIKEKSEQLEDVITGVRSSKVVGKASGATISVSALRCQVSTPPCRCNPELSSLLLPPRGEDPAPKSEQHPSAPAGGPAW